ncbi:MAG: alpha/beta hydrolase [Bifidobacterium sp.]
MMATPRICWTSTSRMREGAALPVIVDFHGGGLYYGNKENNECRDMLLARQGFAVVNANYRLVPR